MESSTAESSTARASHTKRKNDENAEARRVRFKFSLEEASAAVQTLMNLSDSELNTLCVDPDTPIDELVRRLMELEPLPTKISKAGEHSSDSSHLEPLPTKISKAGEHSSDSSHLGFSFGVPETGHASHSPGGSH